MPRLDLDGSQSTLAIWRSRLVWPTPTSQSGLLALPIDLILISWHDLQHWPLAHRPHCKLLPPPRFTLANCESCWINLMIASVASLPLSPPRHLSGTWVALSTCASSHPSPVKVMFASVVSSLLISLVFLLCLMVIHTHIHTNPQKLLNPPSTFSSPLCSGFCKLQEFSKFFVFVFLFTFLFNFFDFI